MTTHAPEAAAAQVSPEPGQPDAPVSPPRRRRRGVRRWKAVRIIVAIVAAAILMFPLYWMIVVAFSPRQELLTRELRLWPREFTLDNFATVFGSFPVWDWFGNSFAIASVVTVITVIVNLLAGYAFAHLPLPGGTVVLLLLLSTLMIPIQVFMVAQFEVVTVLGLYGTYWAVILPTAANALGIFLARQFIIAIPKELVEAARMDGAGSVRVFLRIILPLSRPLIAVLALLTFLSTWNDFSWPLIALKESRLFTLPIGMLFLKGSFGSDYGAIMAFALIAVAPMILLFLLFQRYFVQGFARSGIR